MHTRVKKVKSKRNLHNDDGTSTAGPAEINRPSTSASTAPSSSSTSTSTSSGRRSTVAPLVSTDILAQDALQRRDSKKTLKRQTSSKKLRKGEEKETTFVYEEKELKIAICCAIT